MGGKEEGGGGRGGGGGDLTRLQQFACEPLKHFQRYINCYIIVIRILGSVCMIVIPGPTLSLGLIIEDSTNTCKFLCECKYHMCLPALLFPNHNRNNHRNPYVAAIH